MEAVATNPIFLIEPAGQRVAVGRRRHRLVKGSIEDGDVGDLGEELLCFTNPQETPSIVSRSERNLRLDRPDDVVIDAGGVGEPLTAVDDAVADRIGLDIRECAPHFRPGRKRIAHTLDRSGRDFDVAFGLE